MKSNGLIDTPPLTVLRMEGISKSFSGVKVLCDVNLDLIKGEVHVLVGENGAGKSTLMKILAGVYTLDSGTIELNGRRVAIGSPHEAQQLGISTIFQELSLVPNLSGADNILLGREKRGALPGTLSDRKGIKFVSDLLDNFQIDIDPNQIVGELPASKRQLLEIAKAVSRDVSILVMDESTSSLSKREVDSLFDLIKRLTAQKISVIYISHLLDEIPRIGDRATVMRDGFVVDTVPIDSAFSSSRLVEMMVGRDLSEKAKKLVRGNKVLGETILTVKHLSRHGVFNDVSFHVRRGEIVGVAGLVGSGRTELVRAIYGADPIDSGEISINGQKVAKRAHRPARSKALGVAFVSEDRKLQGLFANQSVAFNITIAAPEKISSRLHTVSKRIEATESRRLVSELDIRSNGIDQEVAFLSGGNQQKVLFARWLLRGSSLYVLDEPTRGIDVGAKFNLYELMKQLTADGAAILFVSSELEELLENCDRILVMRGGVLAADLPRELATPEMILKHAFGLSLT